MPLNIKTSQGVYTEGSSYRDVMTPHIPLAWLQLTQSKGRLIGATAGIVFTVVFSLVQIAFEDALYASVTLLYSHLKADLVLISPRYQCVVSTEDFPERRLFQALAVDGVESVSALYMGLMQWRNPVNRQVRQIFAVGFKPSPGVFDFASVNANLRLIAQPDKVAFDDGSRPEFGPVAELLRTGKVTTELSHRQVECVVTVFRVGANFASDGNRDHQHDTNFMRMIPYRTPGIVDIGLIKLKPGVDASAARRREWLPHAAARRHGVDASGADRSREGNSFSSSLPCRLLLSNFGFGGFDRGRGDHLPDSVQRCFRAPLRVRHGQGDRISEPLPVLAGIAGAP